MTVPDLRVNVQLLNEFEKGLDPRFPERSVIPARVLGYGEISTVLEIGEGNERDLAYKRLSMFKTEQEVENYEALYAEYVQVLHNRIGIQVVPSETIRVRNARGRVILYIAQAKLPPESIGHKAIHHLSAGDVRNLVRAVLGEAKKVFDFNNDELAVGLDAQISNWAIVGFDPQAPKLGRDIELLYFDTSSPIIRKHGEEQLDPELFLRSAPSFLLWIIRLLFLDEVMTRYYDFRRVAVDLVANFYKEQRPELIPDLVDTVNEFFSTQVRASGFEPITVQEVRAYYREDALIWRVYLAFKKIDRTLHRLLGREYPYILPEKVKR